MEAAGTAAAAQNPSEQGTFSILANVILDIFGAILDIIILTDASRFTIKFKWSISLFRHGLRQVPKGGERYRRRRFRGGVKVRLSWRRRQQSNILFLRIDMNS